MTRSALESRPGRACRKLSMIPALLDTHPCKGKSVPYASMQTYRSVNSRIADPEKPSKLWASPCLIAYFGSTSRIPLIVSVIPSLNRSQPLIFFSTDYDGRHGCDVLVKIGQFRRTLKFLFRKKAGDLGPRTPDVCKTSFQVSFDFSSALVRLSNRGVILFKVI